MFSEPSHIPNSVIIAISFICFIFVTLTGVIYIEDEHFLENI